MSNKKRVVADLGQFVSIIGLATDIVTKLAQAVLGKDGGNIDSLRRIINEPELCDRIADLLVAGNLRQLIKACRLVSVDPSITEENFPVIGLVADVSKMFLVSLEDLGGCDTHTDEIGAAIDRLGFRSATLAEQLVWASVKWNGIDLVAALGSSWINGACLAVPYLSRDRKLCVCWTGTGIRWRELFWFLVVRK